jgi:diguanylate cyclase (GGDEF)-like protein
MGSGERHQQPTAQDLTTLSTETTLHGGEFPPRSSSRCASLVVIAGAPADIGTHVLVQREVVIGRVGAGLVLRDGRISRRHARVWEDDQSWWVEDLGSTNGTTLEGRPLVQRAPIGDGARVCLGATIVKFSLVDQTEADYLDQMAKLAGTDPLTGLHATHRFDHLLAEAVRAAEATRSSLAVLMMDLDGLKPINDRHGHRYGAHTIASVGEALGVAITGRGEACRFGGDEFCVFMPMADEERAQSFAESFRQQVQSLQIHLDGVSVQVTISIGLAVRHAPDDPSALMVAADEALYRAKAAGRNRVAR